MRSVSKDWITCHIALVFILVYLTIAQDTLLSKLTWALRVMLALSWAVRAAAASTKPFSQGSDSPGPVGRNRPDATHSITRLNMSPGFVKSELAVTIHFCTRSWRICNTHTHTETIQQWTEKIHTQESRTPQAGTRWLISLSTLMRMTQDGRSWAMAYNMHSHW